MALTNLNSDLYLADSDGGNKIYMDCKIVPDYQFPIPARIESSSQCLPGIDGSGNVIAGNVIHFEGGTSKTAAIFELNIPYMENATRDYLITKYDTLNQMEFSPDNGVTKYKVLWKVFNTHRPPGCNWFTAVIRLKYVEKI